jgi:hypothetical protein
MFTGTPRKLITDCLREILRNLGDRSPQLSRIVADLLVDVGGHSKIVVHEYWSNNNTVLDDIRKLIGMEDAIIILTKITELRTCDVIEKLLTLTKYGRWLSPG